MKLDNFLEEFEGLDARDRLELLVEFSKSLPPLSAENRSLATREDCRIPACQTPVFLTCGVHNGVVQIEADVPESSPTVRGFVSLLVQGLTGETPEAVLPHLTELVDRLELREVLGMTRSRGFAGILDRIREGISRKSA